MIRTLIKWLTATRNNLYTIEPNISKELLNYIQIYEKYFVFQKYLYVLYFVAKTGFEPASPRLQTGPLQNQLAYFALLRAPGGIRTHIVAA